MPHELRLPDLGEGIPKAELCRWLAREGDWLEEGDPLVEVETDKAVMEIPSPRAGRLLHTAVEPGEIVTVGTVIAAIEPAESDGAPPEAQPAVEPDSTKRTRPSAGVRATPRARVLASELGVELDPLAERAGEAVLTERHVRAAADRPGEATPGRPLRGTRRTIAARLSRAHREVPAVTVVEEADFTKTMEVPAGYERLAEIVGCVLAALREHPVLNATWSGSGLVAHERVQLGFAVQTRRGLVVPVLKDADRASREDLARGLREAIRGARQGNLPPERLRGSTFTISHGGQIGGLFATPIVNAPEVAIVGLHRIEDRAMVRDGAVVVRPAGFLSCSFDHRVLDGAQVGRFLQEVVARLAGAGD